MQQFRVIAATQTVSFSEHYHAQLLSRRGDHEAVVGVFKLHSTDWKAFQDWCAAGNIEITYGPTRTAIPT